MPERLQKPLSCDFPPVKCPKYVDLVESKLVITQDWKERGWNCTVAIGEQYVRCHHVCTW